MASYNRIIMMGNLTRDPEYKQLASGQAVCRLGLASNRSFKNRQSGEMVQEVCFVDVDVWGQQAESCRQYLQKGRSVLVEGRLKLDSWQDNDGQRRSKHSIVADRVTFLASAGATDSQSSDSADGDYGSDSQSSSSMHMGAEQSSPVEVKAASKKAAEAAIASLNLAPKAPRKTVRTAPMTEEVMAATGSGEIAFKDQEPFTDDLPF